MANNRELSQFGSFVSVDDTTKEISIASTITQVNAINLNVSGVSTLGIVSSLYVTGITTLGFLTGTDAYFTGIVTANKFVTLGVTGFDNLETKNFKVTGVTTLGVTSATNLTLETLRVSGITTLGVTSASDLSVYQLKVSGISTFTNGPVFIGTETSTGTASQPLQVTGGVYVSANIGIGTTTPKSKLHVQGDALVTGVSTLGPVKIYSNGDIGIVTATSGISTLFYYGDGSELTGIKAAFVGVSTDSTHISRYIPFVDVTSGITTVRTNSNLVYNPSTGGLGIGVTDPIATLDVQGPIISRYGAFIVSGYEQSPVDPETSNNIDHIWHDDGVPGIGHTYGLSGAWNFVSDSDYKTIGNSWLIGGGFSNGEPGLGSAYPLQITGGAYISDNLGIGSTSPSVKLHVQGDARVTGAIYDSTNVSGTLGQVLKSTNTGTKWGDNQITIIDQTVLSRTVYPTFATDIGISSISIAKSDFVYDPYIGNFGIGSTTPSAKLHVQGDARVTGAIYDSTNVTGSSGQFLKSTNTGTKWEDLGPIPTSDKITIIDQTVFSPIVYPTFATDIGISSISIAKSDFVYVPYTGRLGIGTTSPSAALDVGKGNAYISNGDLHINGTPFVFNTRNGLGGFWSNGGINGSSYFNNFSPGGITGFGIKTLSGSAGTFGAVDTNNMYYSVRTRHNGTEGITDFSGLVGIGTTAPTSKLHVQGDLLVTGISTLSSVKIYSNGNNTGIITATSGISTVFYYGDGSGLINLKSSAISGGSSISISANTEDQSQYLTFATGIGTTTRLGIKTTGLVYNPSTGNLGIGTTTPKATLDVGIGSVYISNGDLHINGTPYIFNTRDGSGGIFFNGGTNGDGYVTNTSPGGKNGFAVKTPSGSPGSFGAPNKSNIIYTLSTRHDGTQGITDFTGLVGIGTTNPGEKLQVDGNIRVGISTTSNYIAFRGTDGDGGPNFPLYSHTFIGERIYETGTQKSELLLFKGNDRSDSNTFGPDRIRLAATGGIVFDTSGIGTAGTFEQVGTSTALNTKMVLAAITGNLGIGTTNPTSKLHVEGDVRITGGLYDSGIGAASTTGSSGQILQSVGTGISWVNATVIGAATTIGILGDSSNQTQYLTFVTGVGDTTLGITTTSSKELTFNASTGNLGIGTTNPGEKLHVSGGNVLIDRGDRTGALERKLTIGGTRNYNGGPFASINFSNYDKTNSAVDYSAVKLVARQSPTTVDGGEFSIHTTGAGSTIAEERFKISDAGNLGIGTSTPTSKLHVQGDVLITGGLYDSGIGAASTTGNKGQILQSVGTGISWVNSSSVVGAATTIGILGDSTDQTQYLTFVTGIGDTTLGITTTSSKVLTFNASTGNLGIGTTPSTTSTTKLDVFGNIIVGTSSTQSGVISRRNTNSLLALGGGEGADYTSGANIELYGSNFPIANNANNAYYDAKVHTFRELNAGPKIYASISSTTSYFNNNIGIGTTNPSTTLHVKGDVRITGGLYDSGIGAASTTGTSGQILKSVGTGISWVDVAAIGAATTIGILGDSSNQTQYLTFVTGVGDTTLGITTTSSKELTFNSSTGYLGIGTTNPLTKLHVSGGNIILDSNTSGSVLGFPYIGFGTNAITRISGRDDIDGSAFLAFVIGGNSAAAARFDRSGNLGIGTTAPSAKLHVQGDAVVTGISTLGTVKIYSNGTNGIVTATSVGSTVFYYGDGSGLINIPATSFTGEIGLGTNTYGDYVKNILGTTNEIEVSNTNEEGTTFTIGLPDNVTIADRLTVKGSVQVDTNLNVTGNITVGGTTASLSVTNLQVEDKNIILGITTSPSTGVDVSSDTSANQGGVAIASLEGNPLVKLGISSIPDTYKQIMWFQRNPSNGLYTDAWMFNYGVGIGSTQIANGVRLAVGTGITMSNDSITAGYFYGDGSGLTKIKASAISGGSSFTISSDDTNQSQYLTYATKIGFTTGLGVTTTNLVFNPSTTRLGIGTATPSSNLHVQGDALVTGVSTLGPVKIYSNGDIGIVTATSGISTLFYYGDGSNLKNIPASAISGGSSITISSNTDNQAQYLTYATKTGFTTGLGVTTTNLVFNPSTTRLGIGTTTPSSNLHVQGDALVTGVSTLGPVKIYSNGTNGIVTSSNPGVTTVFYYGDGSNLKNIPASAISGGSSISISANNNNQAQYLTFATGIGTTTGLGITTTNLVFNPSTSRLGIGTTTPSSNLHVQGDALVTGVSTLGPVKIYSSGNTGIITATSGISTVFYYGDGSGLINLNASAISGDSSISINSNNNNQAQYLTFATGTGSTGGLNIDTNIGLVYNPSTERLGIGTTAPIANLHVKGNAFADGNVYSYKNFVNSSSSTNASASSNVRVGSSAGLNSAGTAPLADAWLNCVGYQAGQGFDGSDSNLIGFNAGMGATGTWVDAIGPNAFRYGKGNANVAIGLNAGQRSIGGSNIFIGVDAGENLEGSGNVLIGAGAAAPILNGSGQLVIANQQAGAGQNSTWIYGNRSYNVGLGTTNPTQKLHVQGAVRITGGLYDINNVVGAAGSVLTSIGSSGGIVWSAPSSGGGILSISANNNDQAQYLTFATGIGSITGLNIDNNKGLVYNPSTERLGIGTTAPRAALDISTGDAYISSGDLRINGTSWTFNTRSNGGGYWTNGGTDGIANINNVTPGGSIGLSVKIPSGSAGTFEAPNTADMYDTVRSTHNGTEGITDFRGRVGIGTTTPKAKLHVQGDALVTGVSTLSSVQIYSSGNIGIITATSGLSTVFYYGDGSNLKNIIGVATVTVSTNTTNQNQFLTFVTGTGSSSILAVNVSPTALVYNPGAGTLGLGTSYPTSRFSVVTPSTGDTILQVGDNTSSGSMFRVNNSVGYPLMDIDGDGTILFTTLGNIGIGSTVTSPAYKLDVGGDTNIRNNLSIGGTIGVSSITATNIGITSNLYVGGTIIIGKANFGTDISIAGSMTAATFYGSGIGLTNVPLGQFTAPGTQGQLVFNNNNLIAATSNLFYDNPNARLGIGTTVPTSRLSIVTPSTGENILQVGDNTSSGSMFRVNNSVGYPLMDIDGDGTILFTTLGNIGIGSTITSPAYKLDVGGDTNIRNNLSIGGTVSIGGSVSIGGTVGITSNLYIGGTITIGKANFGTDISIAGSVTANNFVGFGSGLIGVKLDQLSAPGTQGQLVFNNNNLISATTNLFYDNPNARLGIGTTVPSSRLSIVTPSTGENILQVGDNTSSGSMFRVNNSTGYPLMDIDGDGTILFTTLGNIGIGSTITSPAYKLDVGGDTNIRNNLSIGGTIGVSSITATNIGITSNLYVDGTISIGTARFGSNINIAGSVTASNYYGSGTGLTNVPLGQFTAPGIQGQLVFNNNNLISATSNLFYDNPNARLGIGTTVPSSRLSIVTPSTGENILQVGDNTSSGSMFRVNNSVGYPLMDIDGDGTILFTTTGNVGIGTTVTSPAYKLEVGGDVKVGGSPSQGIILTSPNGTKFRIIVNDAGVLSTTAV